MAVGPRGPSVLAVEGTRDGGANFVLGTVRVGSLSHRSKGDSNASMRTNKRRRASFDKRGDLRSEMMFLGSGHVQI
eukprot:scaffold911_cov314-Pavlova_lutheri.AAC.4